VLALLPQTLNEDFFAVVDLQQADLPQVTHAVLAQQLLPAPAAAKSHAELPAANYCSQSSADISCFLSNADVVACSVQVVNLTQALIGEFNRTL
jgi:hypothetical protein